ncbi:hypothetical protein N0V82_010555 [Gnomoniopsis sp. IMI 355080]|nr:hypothetical protein N0V82_010555 [Gnomoniopsis sp. IMI 355080]
MAPGQKMYPRGTVKKIVKAHSNCSVSKNVDVLVSSRAPKDAFREDDALTTIDQGGGYRIEARG